MQKRMSDNWRLKINGVRMRALLLLQMLPLFTINVYWTFLTSAGNTVARILF